MENTLNEMERAGIKTNAFFNLNRDEEKKMVEEEKKELKKIDESIKLAEMALRDGVINEDTFNQLRTQADSDRIKRANNRKQPILVRYVGVNKQNGWIKFETNSQFTKGRKYYQYVKLLDINDIKDFGDLREIDITRLVLSGNVAVFCSCPDFLYKGFKYMGYHMGYGLRRETRFPKIRNPNLKGTICKHLICVSQVFLANWLSIYKDLKKTNYWKSKLPEEVVNKKTK